MTSRSFDDRRSCGFVAVAMGLAGSLIFVSTSGCIDSGGQQRNSSDTATVQPSEKLKTAWTDQASDPSVSIVRWVSVPELPRELAIVDSVFWEPDDTVSLREKIISDPAIKDASVLEVGTGSGLISLCCLQAGAARVIATDINPAAVENVRHNATAMEFGGRLDARLVPRRAPGAWTVIEPDVKFDFIISNPPWEDRKPTAVEQFALYDPSFELLKSLVTGARQRLKPNGRMWLAYGCITAIRKIQDIAKAERLTCVLLDDRKLEELPEVFLPGMLIEISVPE